MRRLFIGFVLVAAFAVAGTVQHPVAEGQGAKKKAAKGGVIEIGEGKDGKYRFSVRDSEGKLLAMSGPRGFASEKDARTAIETLKEVISTAKVTNVGKKKPRDKKDGKDK
jgi:uncharacterized protein YegP (UPF0339 family)